MRLSSSALLILAASSASGFVVVQPRVATTSMEHAVTLPSPRLTTPLFMAEPDKEENVDAQAETKAEEAEASTEEVLTDESTTAVEEEDEEDEEEQEDPELVALKAEIAELESKLKDKRRTVRDAQEKAEEFSKAGYARKVAEMENMRRARNMLQSSNRFSATAAILTEFLPVMDKLETLKETYGEDDFGKQYNALPGAMKSGFAELGVTDYSLSAGEKVDTSRVAVLESEHSEEFAKDTVIKTVRIGLELKGNVVRKAECVASLGSQPVEEPSAGESEEGESKPEAASEDGAKEE